jgi:adenosylhomocysteine nucleosidase
MIAVTFALPQESQDFRRVLTAVETVKAGSRVFLRAQLAGVEVCVWHSGVGPQAAAENVAAFLAGQRPRLLISTGFAGGLDPRLVTGDLLVAENFSAPELLAQSRALLKGNPHAFFGGLTSQAQTAETVAAKAALAQETGALGVDMETAAIAAACAQAGVPLLAARAISDSALEPLPVPFAEWFDLAGQRPRVFGLVKYLALHPGKIAPFTRFVRGLTPARQAFTRFISALIADVAVDS